MSGRPSKPAPSVLGLPPVKFGRLYTYSTACDRALIVLSCICAGASGCILPLFSLVFGRVLSILNDPTKDPVAEVRCVRV